MKLLSLSLVFLMAIIVFGTIPDNVYGSGSGDDVLIGQRGNDDSAIHDTENEGTFVLQPPKEASAINPEVPSWIKTSMGYWVEGYTTDAEFLSAVEFLANEKIIRVAEPASTSGDFDTEMVSMNAQKSSSDNSTGGHFQVDSFFDIFYESYTVDSFFDVFTEMQATTDSFFDVFFEVETPRTNECLRGQELVFDERTSSWQCASANTVDSFFDVFFDVATESSQNSEDIDELQRKIAELERKIAELETGSTSGNVETEFKVEKGQ